jgi:hypothetical protein
MSFLEVNIKPTRKLFYGTKTLPPCYADIWRSWYAMSSGEVGMLSPCHWWARVSSSATTIAMGICSGNMF